MLFGTVSANCIDEEVSHVYLVLQQMIYKHAISTISPVKPLNLAEPEG